MLLLSGQLTRLAAGRDPARMRSIDHERTSVQPGSRIANYEIVRLIGRGGMSEVYEAIQIGTGRPIALKLLGPRAEDPRYVERLQLEGYALARIRHPNVVIVYDAGLTDGQAWIAMDLLEGQSMRDFLWQKGRLPLPQVLAYIGAICDGLESAHRLNIVHRDMKPENVFLTYDGGLKIVDFGNAKFLNSGLVSTDPLRVFGTAAYMSPEQLGVHQSVSPRSDLYAVGLMMYEMLLGRHAYSQGPNPYDLPPSIELCRLQIEEEPRPLAEVDPRIPSFVSDFVTRLTAKDPDRRPASAFLCAREARDMHDFIVREAHSHGLVPAAIPLSAPATPAGRHRGADSLQNAFHVAPVAPDRRLTLRPTTAAAVPRAFTERVPWRSTKLAVGVGVALGVALFAVLSLVRHVGGRRVVGLGPPVVAAHVANAPLPTMSVARLAAAPGSLPEPTPENAAVVRTPPVPEPSVLPPRFHAPPQPYAVAPGPIPSDAPPASSALRPARARPVEVPAKAPAKSAAVENDPYAPVF